MLRWNCSSQGSQRSPHYKTLSSICNYHFTFLLAAFNLVDPHSSLDIWLSCFVPYLSRHSFSVPLLITSHLLTLLDDPSVGWCYLWTPPLVTLFNLMVIYVIIGPNAMPSLECFPEHQFHVINFLLNIVSLMSGNISKLISPNRTYDLPHHVSLSSIYQKLVSCSSCSDKKK